MNLAIRPRAWEGQPLQTLAYFDSIHALVKALNTDAQVSLRLYVQGNILGTARMDKSALGDVSGFWDLLELLRKARLLAQHFQRNVVLPPLEEITNEDMGSVEHLFAVVFEGGHRMSVPNLTFSANIDRSVPAEAKLEDIGTFAIVTADQKYPFFGSTITIDRIETQLTHLKLTRCEPISDGKEARLSFAGTSQSERFVQIAKGELPS